MQKTWQLCTHTICAYTVSYKRVGVVNWFSARLFETHSEVYINAVYAVDAKRLWFWPWQISLLRESFPALSSRVSEFLFLSLSPGDPAAVRQWMTTESVYHKEHYSGLCTKAKTWTQPDSAIHVISSLPSEKSNNKRNVGSRNNSAAAPSAPLRTSNQNDQCLFLTRRDTNHASSGGKISWLLAQWM